MTVPVTLFILIISIFGLTCVLSTDNIGCSREYTSIGFDDLSDGNVSIPSSYEGFNWLNVESLIASQFPESGYFVSLRSGTRVAYNKEGSPMSISAGSVNSRISFSVNSFVAAAAWNNGLVLAITGYRAGTPVFSKSITLQTTSATNVVLNWTNIDEIRFNTSGGVPAYASAAGGGKQFAMDNLCIMKNKPQIPQILYKCDYWGDPQLIKFQKTANEIVSSSWCQIDGPSILFHNSYAAIYVLNSGSQNGDVITQFDITFYDSNHQSICIITHQHFTANHPACGLDVKIDKATNSLNIRYEKARLNIWITYSSWRGGHYKFNIFTSLAHINDPSTRGLCIQGCQSKSDTPELLLTDSTTDREIVTTTQRLSQTRLTIKTTPGYFDAIRKACIIDVTVTGSAEFAQNSATNVVTDILTNTGEFQIGNIMNLVKNATVISERISAQVETQVQTMVNGSIWPCSPSAPICIMPSMLRRKQIASIVSE
ncbi:hypothetical protein I4U23_003581 [Adineta vaga]|nr:hypothetical protein I4U23_003581 [Adineta vaga]